MEKMAKASVIFVTSKLFNFLSVRCGGPTTAKAGARAGASHRMVRGERGGFGPGVKSNRHSRIFCEHTFSQKIY